MNKHSEDVERMARAMCANEGFNPDSLLTAEKVPNYGPLGYIWASDHSFPAWHVYVKFVNAAMTVK